MMSEELSFFSTQELIDEIINRSTFQGIIIHTVDNAKSREWEGERVFRLRFNDNLGSEEAGRLLDVVSRHIAIALEG